jgi:hypothetical protein
MADSGTLVLMIRAASIPFRTGIVTFKTTTSGFKLPAASMAFAPSKASPQTSKRMLLQR